ncbi:MAG: FAD-dependent oxidoreductase [Promicromonosporaceae bacterium]|nr:FAD-dependent oxidoreductase [Promicromonosporaceae bacterium]
MADKNVYLAVVGFGKGGKTLAMRLAALGRQVALIEQSPRMYGGTCINVGCVPTKALIYRAEHRELLGEAPTFATAAAQTKGLTAAMRAKNFALVDSPATGEVLDGRARFIGPRTLEITRPDGVSGPGGIFTVEAEHVVINTGSRPVLPASIAGLRESRHVIDSTGLLDLTAAPAHLIVLGGSFIGVELASMMASYGVPVTLLHAGQRLLEAEDEAMSAEIHTLLTEAGVQVLLGAQAVAVTDEAEGASVTYRDADGSHGTTTGSHVLAALGRRPNTDGLGLAEVGIEVDARGAVVVDEFCRTTAEGVFAVGDCNGGPQFTYISYDDHRVVLDQLVGLGRRSTADRVAVPHCVFTTPPLARVGMTLAEARATGRRLLTASRRVAEMAIAPRAKIVAEPRGVMTAIVDAETDEILGVSLLAAEAHEIVNTVALAMRAGLTASALRDSIFTHPSMTEAFNDLFAALRPAH